MNNKIYIALLSLSCCQDPFIEDELPNGRDLEMNPCEDVGDSMWMEIDFFSATKISNPSFKYSEGISPSYWQPFSKGKPFVEDIYGRATIEIDPFLGKVANLKDEMTSINLVFGTQGLLDYSHVSVCLMGRSNSEGGPTSFKLWSSDQGSVRQGAFNFQGFEQEAGFNIGKGINLESEGLSLTVIPLEGWEPLSMKRLRISIHDYVLKDIQI